MKKILFFLLACVSTWASANAQDIVVNRIYNATNTPNGLYDAVELLVIADSLDIRNFYVKDFEADLTTDAGGKYKFKDTTYWQHLRSGTTIVLRKSSPDSLYAEDTNAADFTIDLLFENTTYLTSVALAGHKFNITSTDMVVIKTGNMTAVSNSVHAFATNNAATKNFYTSVTSPKLISAAATVGGSFQYPLNPTATLTDFNGSNAALSSSVNYTWGYGFGVNNMAFIDSLRNASAGLSAPTNLVATTLSGKEIMLSWIDNAMNESAFEIERSDDGTKFIKIATVAANTASFTDKELLGSTQYHYKVRVKNNIRFSNFSSSSAATTNAFMEEPQLSTQAIHPNFFGINYWYPGTTLPLLKNDLQQAGLRIIRIGGNEYNKSWLLPSDYDSAITYVQSIGAQPLLQIPISLTDSLLSEWLDYFNNVKGYAIKYWAIGNEPDTSDNPYTATNEPIDWSNGILPFEGYTYPQWVAHFDSLAVRLKTHLPRALLVGGDLRLFYETVIDHYYKKFIDSIGTFSHNGVPLLDYFSFHYYGFRKEDTLDIRFNKVKALIQSANQVRSANGLHELRIAVTEVNTTTGAQPYPWQFRAGQFIALMQKKAMQQGALAVTPWSIYESRGDKTVGGTDFSLYNNGLTRRSTMWHVAMLSNNRKDSIMNGEMEPNTDVAFVAMRDATGYTVMVMNMSVTSKYSYRVSLDNSYHGIEQIRIKLEGYPGVSKEISDSIAAETTHLYRIDASGKILSRLTYSASNLANDEGPVEELYDTWAQQYFYVVNKHSADYIIPKMNSATGLIIQRANPVLTSEFIQWSFEPAATPGFYYIVNRSTGKAIRPQNGVGGLYIEQITLDNITRADESMMWAILTTDEEGYYRLQNKASGSYLTPKANKLVSGQSIVQSTLVLTDASFKWRLEANGLLPASRSIQVLLTENDLTTEFSQDKSIRIYPNPTSSTFMIDNLAAYERATLTDVNGHVVLQQTIGRSTTIDISTLPPGVYILVVATDKRRTVRRILKR